MPAVTVFDHQGHPVVKTVFPREADLATLKVVLAETGVVYSRQTAGSILALVVFEGQDFDEVTINLFEGVAKANAQVVRATAFLGVNGPQKALFNAMISITGRKGKLFDAEQDALAYLAHAARDEDIFASL